MSGFDARWMTVSFPVTAPVTLLRSAASPRTTRSLGSSACPSEMPFSPGRKIVEDGHRFGSGAVQKSVDKVTTDEPGTAHDADPRDAGTPLNTHVSSSHLARWRASRGWVTSRCQITAHNPSVCGVTRSGYRGGIKTMVSATFAANPPSRPDDGEDRRTANSRQLHRRHQVAGHSPFGVSATHGQDQQAVELAQVRSVQPIREDTVPPIVVNSGGEF